MGAEEAAMGEVRGEEAAPPPLARVSETGRRPDRAQRLLALSGVVGPILFTTVVTVLGFLRPGYSHITQAISELGEVGAPYAVIQNANFFILGLLTIAFAFGLHRGISGGMGSKTGPALLAVFGGLSGVANGFLPCDPGCDVVTLAGGLHIITALTGFIAFIAAALILPRRMKMDSLWQSLGTYSQMSGALALAFLLLFVTGGVGGAIPFYIPGILQRLFVAVMLLWILVMAVRLLRLSLRPGAEGAPV